MDVSDRLSEICDYQGEEGYVLTGFFLEPEDLASIRDTLSVDDPDVGAEGRYSGVPVFPKHKAQPNTQLASRGLIVYSFVKMGVLDLGNPVE
ncbi:hypothetical protein [Blastopirellula retiformator]|uniref:hypothetical protein n=1 Tax=Blastopirellula retiformator TaxID=2527970 RepID=UPI0011B37085|nr:hypothetical protein [Blastopirellula retiformator]